MLTRKINNKISQFFDTNSHKALLITGARQVGKTYIIREYIKTHFSSSIEINFLENTEAKEFFSDVKNSSDILFRLSALADKPLIKGETIIFLDEVQECPELITAIKFLVEDGSYKYILSGSLLGVELRNIHSVPVGYMDIMEMYPLDFEEFCYAVGVSENVISVLRKCFLNRLPVDLPVHNKMMELFKLYLIIGGMPAVVNEYTETNNLKNVISVQVGINDLYKIDISKYDKSNKLYIKNIFELIPSELNAKNKRFIMKNLNKNFKLSRYENSFLWLKDAGVALPVYSANEPTVPLKLSKATNLFKLFSSDVGLLSAMYADGIQLEILKGNTNINFGSIYENAVAQELKSHGFELYYFNSKKQGEVDFLIEDKNTVIPIEVKSGKDYKKHSALDNLLKTKNYNIESAYVFCNDNLSVSDGITYCPVYMIAFLEKTRIADDLIYKIDISELNTQGI